jgi:hypothetical protein
MEPFHEYFEKILKDQARRLEGGEWEPNPIFFRFRPLSEHRPKQTSQNTKDFHTSAHMQIGDRIH